MKFFTREWYHLKYEEESEKIKNAYYAYLEKIYDKLPLILQIFSKTINFHDGIVEKVFFFKESNTLLLKLSVPTWTDWFFKIEIKYIDIINLDLNQIIRFFKNKKTEVWYDEVDIISNGNYAHRFFFSTEKSLEIIFKDIEISIQNLHPDDFNENKRCKLEIV